MGRRSVVADCGGSGTTCDLSGVKVGRGGDSREDSKEEIVFI